MILTPLQQAQRVVGAAYARRFANPATLELITSLERENAGLQESIVLKQQFLQMRSRSYVVTRAMSGVLAAAAIALVLYGQFYSGEGACLREGMQRGQADALRHGTAGSVVSDVCKQNQHPVLARFRGREARFGSDAPSALRGGARRP